MEKRYSRQDYTQHSIESNWSRDKILERENEKEIRTR